MVSREQYALGDFTKHSTGKLATQFAAVSNMALYEFSEKLYLDEKQRAHRCHMLFVGHYSRRFSGPPVWTYATGEKICYYSGRGNQVILLALDTDSSKVYYDPPFSYIGGSQEYSNMRPGVNTERRLERAVVESAINFVFLMTGRLEAVLDLVNPDLLCNFRLACANLQRHQKLPHTTGSALYEQDSENGVSAPAANARPHQSERTKSVESNDRFADHSRSSGSISLRKRQVVDRSDDLVDDPTRCMYGVFASMRIG
jgi:hypothetical protein